MTMDFVIVEMHTINIFDFLRDGETAEEGKSRGEASYKEWLEGVKKHLRDYGGDYWAEQVKQYQNKVNAGCKVMSFEEYKKIEKKKLLSDELKETTEDTFNDALDILPPLCWCTIKGVEMFCISEMYTGTYTTQYAKYNGKYYTKMVDSTDKTTWIYNYLIKEN